MANDLASEIIHSHRLMWSFGESGYADGIYLSSYKNERDRVILVSLDTISGIIESVADDHVVSARFELVTHPTKPPSVKRTLE